MSSTRANRRTMTGATYTLSMFPERSFTHALGLPPLMLRRWLTLLILITSGRMLPGGATRSNTRAGLAAGRPAGGKE